MNGYAEVMVAFLLFSVIFAGMLVMSKMLAPKNPYKEKSDLYECGSPILKSEYTMDIKYYLLAIMFTLFDIEILFIIPWSVHARALGAVGFAEIAVFVILLFAGYIYAYLKGALKWQ